MVHKVKIFFPDETHLTDEVYSRNAGMAALTALGCWPRATHVRLGTKVFYRDRCLEQLKQDLNSSKKFNIMRALPDMTRPGMVK